MKIRVAGLNDIEGVLALYDEFNRERAPRLSIEKQSKIYSSLMQAGGQVLVAEEKGEIIGTCTINICQNFSWSGRPYAIIENIIVTQPQRGSGIGKALLGEASQFAENQGCYKVALMTGSKRTETLRFYESAGFSGDKTGFQKRFST